MNILVLCTGNSARSILLECLIRGRWGAAHHAFSAGSKPSGTVHPGALRLLARKGFSTHGLRSKSWDEFAAPDAPRMDLVITVCDNAANEPCPIWPGTPRRLHWGVDDPASVTGDTAIVDAAFDRAFHALETRALAFFG
jgi:protein-tyrosine-phosphatase